MKNSYSSILLLSGGLDSALNLALAKRKKAPVLALTFDYGQRAAVGEIKAAAKLAAYYQCDLKIIKLPWMAPLLPPAMRDKGAALPPGAANVAAVWVPNRNGVFVAIAAAFAEKLAANVVIAGFNAEEAAQFPDNSGAFVAAANAALAFSTRGRVRLMSFTADMDKAAIIAEGVRLGLPFRYVFPCYREGPRPCGVCSSCRRTARAFARAGYDEYYAAVFGENRAKKIDIRNVR